VGARTGKVLEAGRGEVVVRIPGFADRARAKVLQADAGAHRVPRVGATVLVGEVDEPGHAGLFVFGVLPTTAAEPPEGVSGSEHVSIDTQAWRIRISPGAIEVASADPNSNAGVVLRPDGAVHVQGDQITIHSAGHLDLRGKPLLLNGRPIRPGTPDESI
jgi:hypothetical protein